VRGQGAHRIAHCCPAPPIPEPVARIAFIQEYTIILQHWGLMVGLMGVFKIVAAFRAEWRTPILIYSAVEKVFMVYLVSATRRKADRLDTLHQSVSPAS
jgi:hypothetical protein